MSRKPPRKKKTAPAAPSGEVRRPLDWQKAGAAAAMLIVSAAATLAAFAPFDLWPLAYLCLSGWAVFICQTPNRRRALAGTALMGLVFWSAALYWLWWVTLAGYLALVVYLTMHWMARALLVRWMVRRGGPIWLALPVVWVAGEYLQAHLISGFPWFFLSQTQYGQVWLIQIADAAGQYGVSFYVALVNGLAAGLWITWSQRGRGRNNILPAIRQNVVGLAVAGLLLTGMVGYSLFRLSQPRGPKAGPVAVVQQAFPIALGRQGTSDVEAFKAHVAATEQLAALAESRGSRIQWILWPETMLPRGLNLDFVSGLSPDGSVELESDRARDFTRQNFGTETLEAREIYARLLENSRLYLDRIDRMVRDIDAPLLGGGGSLHWEPELGGERTPWLSRNSVMLFVPGLGQTQLYSKIQLVPFSEYVPFRQSAPGVHTWLRGFVPPVMTQLFPGQIATVFRIQTDQGPLRVAAPVCYEGTFARICRRLVWQEGGKAVDVIANVSNDGWFVWPGTNRGSTEQAQHLSHYVYRAIETRVPVVRAVNTGISASIDSNGRIVARVVRDGQEVMVTGGLLLDGAGPTGQDGLVAGPQILLDRRATLYSLVGDMFAQAVSLAVGIWTAVLLVARFRSSRRKAPPGTIKEGRPDGKIQ